MDFEWYIRDQYNGNQMKSLTFQADLNALNPDGSFTLVGDASGLIASYEGKIPSFRKLMKFRSLKNKLPRHFRMETPIELIVNKKLIAKLKGRSIQNVEYLSAMSLLLKSFFAN